MKTINDSENLEQAIAHMKQGQFNAALGILLNEIQYKKDSLQILLNIASCYYMVNDYIKYKHYTLELMNQYETTVKSGTTQDLRSPLLALVRLLEELGEIALCYRLLKEHCPSEIKDRLECKLLAQKLRLNASFPVHTEIAELYQCCDFLNIKTDTTYIDLQGALLLADWTLFGAPTASLRIEHFLKQSSTLDHDRRLLVFDHIFEALKVSKTESLNLNLLDHFVYLNVDPFEQVIWDLFLIDKGQSPNKPIDSFRTEGLSPMGAIKIHYLLLQRANTVEAALQIRKKLTFLISSLSFPTQTLFSKNWTIQQEKIEIEIKDESAVIEGREYSLKKSPSIRALFEELSNENKGSTEQLIQKIWQNEFDENSFSRLRVLVTRGNAFLKKTTGLTGSISLSKHQIQLNANITIRKFGA